MQPFFNYNLDLLEIENSSICNAACPQCTRQVIPNDTSWFKQDYLRLEVIQKIPDHVWSSLTRVSFAGTLGDPCAAPNIIQIVKWIKNKAPQIEINIETNGGMKNPEFWRRLARALDGYGHVQFAIDGLQDTNHIYRVNVKWEKLMQNVNAFVGAGGRAIWQYIIFEHNEHQLDAARQMAVDLKFIQFNPKKSHRFMYNDIFDRDMVSQGVPLRPPKNQDFVHPVVLYKKKKATVDNIIEESLGKPIECFAEARKSLYIDHTGKLFPCCFVSGTMYMYTLFELSGKQPIPDAWIELWETHGKDKLDLAVHSWESILNGPFFNQVEQSWSATSGKGSLFACVSVCAKSTQRTNDPFEFGKLNQKLV